MAAVLAEEGKKPLQIISAIAREEASLKRDALIRRRRAKQDCYECPVRTECLTGALARREAHGTWGGLFEEEIQKTMTMQRRRDRKMNRAAKEQPGQAA